MIRWMTSLFFIGSIYSITSAAQGPIIVKNNFPQDITMEIFGMSKNNVEMSCYPGSWRQIGMVKLPSGQQVEYIPGDLCAKAISYGVRYKLPPQFGTVYVNTCPAKENVHSFEIYRTGKCMSH